jgi:hypothetical protein
LDEKWRIELKMEFKGIKFVKRSDGHDAIRQKEMLSFDLDKCCVEHVA